ncbi:dirigent protein 1-like [Brachypodium distachyon]|uniref:dirigent protein 1-like n=1 Tax=Brachypodium distachyon TaxID=15368 RepID=UPI000234E8D6|nr:dirigent protein 1-like [Brachypodium distachyon]|eukprot:XP_024314562.1 dirigent protein 1-like [Brachypodium distachyon]
MRMPQLLVNLHFYMHDITGGPGQTAARIVTGSAQHPGKLPGTFFGDTTAIDDLLTDGPGPASRPVGRAQGTYVLAAMDAPVLAVSATLKLTDGEYNGSTVVVAGRDDVLEPLRELAVVGGTGRLRRADGYVVWRTAQMLSPDHAVLELDVHATVPATSL